MSTHLTDEALQAHLFKLSDDDFAAQHLEVCPACTERYAQLQQQFSALELLKEDVPLREELLADTLARINQPAKRPVWIWIAGIAAAIALLWAFNPGGPSDPAPSTAQTPDVKPGGQIELALDAELEALRADPPFAPGSNIELNVLPRRDAVQLSIYNAADLTMVRERRSLTMKKGWNWMQFMWANTLIDPTSLSLEPKTHTNKVSVEQLVFPPRMSGVGRWLIFSGVSGPVDFEITYFTSGISWRAFYMGTLSTDESHMSLQGHVRLENQSGDDYEQAQTRLVVGKVKLLDEIKNLAQRTHAYGSPNAEVLEGFDPSSTDNYQHFSKIEAGAITSLSSRLGRQKQIKKEALSEYFLYTIEGKETIPHQWAKRLPSFKAEKIPVESLYKFDQERWQHQTMRFLSFANDEKHKLGETPLPNGRMRIFRQLDAEQHLNYVGGAEVKYIPVEQEVELELGPSQKVQVQPIKMSEAMAQVQFDGNGNIQGWDTIQDWTFDLRNTRELPIKLEITRGTGTAYWAVKLSDAQDVKYTKHDLNHARFELRLPPRSRKTFSYQLTTHHGTREQHDKP